MNDYYVEFDSGVIIIFHNRNSFEDVISELTIMNVGEINSMAIFKKH